jgi:putative intracellular protease/amidase
VGKIAVILTDPSDGWPFIGPVEALGDDGYELIHVRLRQGEKGKGRKRKTQINKERTVNSVSVEDFDGLLIPRSYTLDELRGAEDVIQFVEEFVARRKPIWVMHDNS